jgi:flagellar motility protein MotE (MotC chaperone)
LLWGIVDKGTHMKKMITLIRGIVISLVVIMYFHVTDIVYELYGSHNVYMSVESLLAQTGSTGAVSVKDEVKAPSDHETGLMKNLQERKQQLDTREKALKEEESKIETLKMEVTENMEALKALEEKMSPPLEVQKVETDNKYKALAKMYEATPPEKAAIIFEKMDRKMAAEIMLRMNSKKAGAIWAHINRDVGLGIVREITSSQSVDAVSATRIAKEISGEESLKPDTLQKIDTENIAGTDKEIPKAKLTKPETFGSAERKVSPITLKRNAGIKEEKSKNVRSGGQKPFAIQVKVVRDLEMAREYTKMLKEEGIDAHWSEMNLKGKETLYRILISHFTSREDALKYMKNNNIDRNYPGSFIYKSNQVFPNKKKKRK